MRVGTISRLPPRGLRGRPAVPASWAAMRMCRRRRSSCRGRRRRLRCCRPPPPPRRRRRRSDPAPGRPETCRPCETASQTCRPAAQVSHRGQGQEKRSPGQDTPDRAQGGRQGLPCGAGQGRGRAVDRSSQVRTGQVRTGPDPVTARKGDRSGHGELYQSGKTRYTYRPLKVKPCQTGEY